MSGDGDGVPSKSNLKILVVDDHPDCLHSMAELLRILGHQLQEARGTLEAISFAQEFLPDIVMLELNLRGLSGYELSQYFVQVHTVQQKRPFLMAVTNAGTPQERKRSAEAGIDVHLVKPVDPIVLEVTLSLLKNGDWIRSRAQA